MKTFLRLSPALQLLAASCAVVLSLTTTRGETSLSLDIAFGIRYVPPSQVTVPAGEYLRITAPDIAPLHWTHDNRTIPGATDRSLVLESVQASDAGTYVAVYETGVTGQTSQPLILGVGPTNRLVNLSNRAQVGVGEKTFITGFVVAGRQHKKIIIRAIGPSLTRFGLNEPVAEPAIAIFDAEGRPYTNSYVYPAVVGGPTYESDLAESLVKAGAHPLPEGTKDVVEMRPFLPGAYTVHVSSADGSPGVVLCEVFEVP